MSVGLSPAPTLTYLYDGGRFGVVRMPIWYVTRPDDLDWVCARVADTTELGIDLETGGLDPRTARLATIQLGTPLGDDPWAVVLDARCFTAEQLAPLLALLVAPGRRLIGHNLKFEAKWLRYNYGLLLEQVYCTQVTEQVIRAGLLTHPNAQFAGTDIQGSDTGQTQMALATKRKRATRAPKGLGDDSKVALKPVALGRLMARYGGVDVDKDHDLRLSFDRTPPGQHSPRQLRYAASDVVYPFWIKQVQQRYIKERGVGEILRMEYALIGVLADMELAGMAVDRAEWTALAAKAEADTARHQAELDALMAPFTIQQDLFGGVVSGRPPNPYTGKPWNWSSADQVKDAIVLYCEHKRWPIELVVTDERARELQLQYGAPWAERINGYERQRAVQEGRPPKLVYAHQAPLWLIPETEHFLLLTTDWKNLTIGEVRGLLPVELVRPLVAYAKASMKATTYGRNYLRHVREDGRMYAEFQQCMAATGRLSSSPNLQNLPRDKGYRECFKPAPGYRYCIADLSQIEPRLLAQVSGDDVYTETYRQNGDLYIAIGERSYGKPIDKHTPEGKLMRQSSKVQVLSLAYLMGPAKYRTQYTLAMADAIRMGTANDIDLEQARADHARFFEVCAGVKAYQEAYVNKADFDHEDAQILHDDLVGQDVVYIKAPCGRIRLWTRDMNRYTEPVNFPIQGSGATGTKIGLVLMAREIRTRGWDAKIVNVIHDEIIVEAHESIAEECALVLRECMARAFDRICPDVPVVAEPPESYPTGVTPYWTK